MSQQGRGALYGILAAAIWGGMYVVSDIVLKVIPPFTLLNMRIGMGLVVLLAALYAQGKGLPAWPMPRRAMGVGIVGFGLSLGAQFVGTDLSTAVNGALVTSASPAFIVLFAVLILHERLTLLRIAAVVLATIGVLIIIDPTQADLSSDTFAGNVFLAIAALTWGLYSVLVRSISRPETVQGDMPDTLQITAGAFMGGLLLTIPAMVIELGSGQRTIGTIDAGVVLGVLYLGIVSTALAMWLWNRAFTLIDASVASLFFFAQPLTGALLGALFLNQPMTSGLWIGGALIALGVLLSLWDDRKAAQAPVQPLQESPEM
jgi:drug/metabolite transporter (DMT)-like permease